MKKLGRKAVHEIVEAAGGTLKVSRAFRISDAAVSRWKSAGVIPAERAVMLWLLTKKRYTPHDICPTVFPKKLRY
jgi:hypothetical protein